jgi:hypothetical protein
MEKFNGFRPDPLRFPCDDVLEPYRFVSILNGKAVYPSIGDTVKALTVERSTVSAGASVQPIRSANGSFKIEVATAPAALGQSVYPGPDGRGYFKLYEVTNMTTTTPPISPSAGDKYIVGAEATGAWAGKDDKVAIYADAAWTFVDPTSGMVILNSDDSKYYQWSGTDWDESGTAPCIANELKAGVIECYKLTD